MKEPNFSPNVYDSEIVKCRSFKMFPRIGINLGTRAFLRLLATLWFLSKKVKD